MHQPCKGWQVQPPDIRTQVGKAHKSQDQRLLHSLSTFLPHKLWAQRSLPCNSDRQCMRVGSQ